MEVLPKGSSHLDGTTEIDDFLYKSKILLWGSHGKILRFLCLKENFSLGSFPATIAFQFGNSSKIFITAGPNRSYPLEEFSLPVNTICFFLYL